MPMKPTPLAAGLLLAGVAALLAPGRAQAQIIGGQALMAVCSGTNPEQVGDCVGFISGVADSFAVIQRANPGHDQICIPSGTNPGQVHDAVINVLNADPGTPQRPAAVDVAQALHVAYPCGVAGHPPAATSSTPAAPHAATPIVPPEAPPAAAPSPAAAPPAAPK